MASVMRSVMGSTVGLACSVVVWLLFATAAMGESRHNVLILHEGSRLLPYQALMARELQKDLAQNPAEKVEIFEEYLDNWRLDEDLPRSASALEAKYSDRKFEVVFADGEGALKLLLDHPPDFLERTPVVFLSVPDFQLPTKLPVHVTGVATHVDYVKTIQFARTIQPDLEHIYYIDSEPLSDAAKNEMFKSELRPLQNQLDITFWEQDDIRTLLKKVSNLPEHSAVLFDSYFEDPEGESYVPAQVGAMIAISANAPVYTPYQTMIGNGAVGGVVVDFEAIGRAGAKMALAIMHGAKVSEVPVQRSANVTMVDWKQFERLHLPAGVLPTSTVVLYREPGIWMRYRWYFLAGGLVMLLQTGLIVKLMVEERRRRESEKATRELAGRLIHAQEEERRRIAAELHDDVGQRLALMCIQLDRMRNSGGISQEMLVRELSVLYDEADLISSDLHQFSRELHPAIIERLGLLTGLRRLCKDFSQHREIEVNLQTSGEERAIHRDTALALFRVAQECLMNIAKHSGVASCDVALIYMRDWVRLTVEDKGLGFEMKELREKTGLGVESMRERLRSVGGVLHIDSAPLRGTRIRAEAPIGDAVVEIASADDVGVEGGSLHVPAVRAE